MAESILSRYDNKPLINKYHIYQHLMNYWNEAMKDDAYMLIEDGWKATLEPITDSKGKIKKGEFDCPLIPKLLLVNRYFSKEQAAIEVLEQELESLSGNLQELLEEHAIDEGLLSEALNDNGKATKVSLLQRQKELKKNSSLSMAAEPLSHYGISISEEDLIKQIIALFDEEADKKKSLKDAQLELEKMVLDKYPALSKEEIQTLVVEDKWLASIKLSIQTEIDGISQGLTHRIKELGERYDTTLPVLNDEVASLTEKVNSHLNKMGIVWS